MNSASSVLQFSPGSVAKGGKNIHLVLTKLFVSSLFAFRWSITGCQWVRWWSCTRRLWSDHIQRGNQHHLCRSFLCCIFRWRVSGFRGLGGVGWRVQGCCRLLKHVLRCRKRWQRGGEKGWRFGRCDSFHREQTRLQLRKIRGGEEGLLLLLLRVHFFTCFKGKEEHHHHGCSAVRGL